MRGLAVRLHQELLTMAAPAGVRNVSVIDRGIRISARQHLVGVPVTVLTIGRGFAGSGDLCMRAVRVGVLRIGVAVSTENLLRRRVVRKTLYVLVAIDAGQLHGTVDGVFELFCVDEEGDRLAVDVG